MLARHSRSAVALFCLVAPSLAAEPAPSATTLWQRGQEALRRGQSQEAIPYFQQSLKLDPELARNHLSLAAAYADVGQEQRAATHLERYLRAKPDHHAARLHYAEMLLRLRRPQAARAQYERCVADIQDRPELAAEHLVHCHSQLMEIAEADADGYGEHLHRGIGLFHVACRYAALPDTHGEMSVESLLCRAAGELTLARLARPDEARPCWYLYEVWSRLARRQPAARWLRAAEEAAPFSYLTPAEQRGLGFALDRSERDARK